MIPKVSSKPDSLLFYDCPPQDSAVSLVLLFNPMSSLQEGTLPPKNLVQMGECGLMLQKAGKRRNQHHQEDASPLLPAVGLILKSPQEKFKRNSLAAPEQGRTISFFSSVSNCSWCAQECKPITDAGFQKSDSGLDLLCYPIILMSRVYHNTSFCLHNKLEGDGKSLFSSNRQKQFDVDSCSFEEGGCWAIDQENKTNLQTDGWRGRERLPFFS